MIDTILFDYAGVLTKGDPGYLWYSKNVPDFIENKSFYDELGHSVDLGILTKDQFVEKVSAATGIPEKDIWKGIKSSTIIDHQVVEYISQLKNKYKIALVSNYVHEWLNEIMEENNLKQYFDVIVISSLEKVAKPNREIFEITVARLDSKFEHSVLIDDRQVNITGAENIGIKGLLYTSSELLISKLDLLTSSA